jgi:ADP-ribosylglycohydrolase
MYSDDTNSTLALATSLVEKQGLMALHAAHTYGRFWQSVPQRGYPDSAKAVMKSVLKGADLNITGRVSFPAGSFANGGATGSHLVVTLKEL